MRTNENASAHALSSELAKLCLPRKTADTDRRLAWVNSICCLFLLVGLLGLLSPRVQPPPRNPTTESVAVMLVPAVETPTPRIAESSEQPSPPDDVTIERPVVTTVVAADANAVAFAVPVTGPVILAPAQFAAAGPKTNQITASPKSTPYIPSEADWGGHKLEYPSQASRRGYQGKVILDIVVTPSGEISSVKVRESSGYKILDDAASEHVQRHLRLRQPPGTTRLHTLDIVFQLRP